MPNSTVNNYGGQNYNAPVINAYLGRNYLCGTQSLNTNGTFQLFEFDAIVMYRGGEITTLGATLPTAPAAGLIVTVHLNSDQSGINFTPQEDFGDGVFITMLPAPSVFPSGFTDFSIKFSGFYFKATATRIANATTTVTYHVSVTEYQ